MTSITKSRPDSAMAHFVCLLVMLTFYSLMTGADSQMTGPGTANYLLTGLDMGSLSTVRRSK